MLKHIILIVGNGSNISLWYNKWCFGFSLQELFCGPLPLELDNLKVDYILDLQNSSHPWQLRELNDILPYEMKIKILYIPISSTDTLSDTIAWPSHSGECTPKVACDLLTRLPKNMEVSFINRNWIWKSNLPPKLRIFLWKLNIDRLPTKTNLHWLPTKMCSVCNKEHESGHHIFRTCRFAKLV